MNLRAKTLFFLTNWFKLVTFSDTASQSCFCYNSKQFSIPRLTNNFPSAAAENCLRSPDGTKRRPFASTLHSYSPSKFVIVFYSSVKIRDFPHFLPPFTTLLITLEQSEVNKILTNNKIPYKQSLIG